MTTAGTIALLAATYLILFALEHGVPLRRATARLGPRLWVNGVVSITALITAAVLVRPAALTTLDLAEGSGFGLMRLAGLAGVAEIAMTFVFMDLTFYYWHIANHRVPFLWRIHNVHHIDPDLDVTTGFRFHFAEVALSAGFRVVQVLAIGPSLLAFLVYEVAFQTGTLFHHSNVRLPYRLEWLLNLVLVTPRMHGIHHSNFRDETNSNFGVVFSGWDRLHRTARFDVPQRSIVIGIPGYSSAGDNRVRHCLAMPFLAQRDYWIGTEGLRISRQPTEASIGAGRLSA